jgi:hypothetical protein
MSDVMSKNREEQPEPGTLKPLNPEPLNLETPKIRRINIDKINPCFVNYLRDGTLDGYSGFKQLGQLGNTIIKIGCLVDILL